MTKRELIEELSDPAKQIPDDAVICAFNADEQKAMSVTGFLYGGKDNMLVELCTDSQQE